MSHLYLVYPQAEAVITAASWRYWATATTGPRRIRAATFMWTKLETNQGEVKIPGTEGRG
jgi:hypothetical protein